MDDSRRLKKYFVIGALELLGIQLFVPFFKNWTPQFRNLDDMRWLRHWGFTSSARWLVGWGICPPGAQYRCFVYAVIVSLNLFGWFFAWTSSVCLLFPDWDIYIYYIPYLRCVCFAWPHLTQLLQRYASLYQDHSAIVTMRLPGQPADCWWETPHHSLATSCGSAMFSHRRKILWKHSVTIWAVLRFPDLD